MRPPGRVLLGRAVIEGAEVFAAVATVLFLVAGFDLGIAFLRRAVRESVPDGD